MLENGRIHPAQFPGVKERRPVNERHHFFQGHRAGAGVAVGGSAVAGSGSKPGRRQSAHAGEFRLGQVIISQFGRVGAGRLQGQELGRLGGMRGAQPLILGAVLLHELIPAGRAEEIAGHRHRPAGVQHMDHRLTVVRRNLDGRMRLAGGGAADQQRQLAAGALQFARHVRHFVERRRNQPAQADDIRLFFAGGLRIFSHETITPKSITS